MKRKPLSLRSISLFTGAGGMDIGFQNAGFEVVWANELMKHAAETYRLNNDAEVMHCGDLTKLIEDIPQKNITCVFGGPPCQGFSVAGKMDKNDPRSKLVFDFMEVVRRTKSKSFVMENVKALASLEKFSGVRQELLKTANELGYVANFYVLNAREFGVPQSRERVFFIGFRKELKVKFSASRFSEFKKKPNSVGNLIKKFGKAGTEKNPLTCKAKITLAQKPIMRKSPYAGMLFNGMGRPLNLASVSYTLPASMGGNKTPIVDEGHLFEGGPNWVENYHANLMESEAPIELTEAPPALRRLTLKEAAAIQTFPREYKFSGPMSSQYTQIGNAVPCGLAEAVASAVKAALLGLDYEEECSQNELAFSDV